MIKVNKRKEPAFFKSARAKVLKNRIARHFSKPIEERSQTKFPVSDFKVEFEDIAIGLLSDANYKCAYCESLLDYKKMEIDHFRPYHSAADTSGRISLEDYWWLAVIWSNLYPVCITCKYTKKNYFPVLKQRTTLRYWSKATLFNIENPVFIDPEYENPEEYFHYSKDGIMLSFEKRGETTINLLNLNRPALIDARRKAVQETEVFINEIESKLRDDEKSQGIASGKIENSILNDFKRRFENSKLSYLGIRRYFLRQFILESTKLESIIDTNFKRQLKLVDRFVPMWDGEPILEPIKTFQIETISINNYKSINDLTINLNRTNEGNAGWAILIGENGVGKSSTLTATLKALIGRDYYGLKFNKEEIKRGQEEGATINLAFDNLSDWYTVSIGNRILHSLPKGYFIESSIMAFGPFKHASKKLFGKNRFKSGCFVDNFFNPATPLHNALNFILQLSENQFNYVSIAILDLLMLENKAIINRDLENHTVWFTYSETGIQHYFNELSDGYQSVITLGCNIIEGLLRNNESIANASGFVFIDEIGANLHPRWKMQIVKRLRRTFPNVQFLVTTHDPLCLKGIEANETYVLKSNNGNLEVLTDLPNPSEFRADQLLTSEFFGLYSTVDPEMETAFKAYYELLYKPEAKRTKQNNKRLKQLKEELKAKNHLGDSLREELLYVAIDTILAKHKENAKPFSRLEVEKDVKAKAIELIDEFLEDLEE